MRVFLDTNVLISALATRGLCAELYERLLMEHEVVIDEPVVAEVLDIMHRKFSAGKKLLAKVEAELRLLEIVPAQSVAPKLPIKYREDPWIIACALARWRGKRIVLLREMPNCWGWAKWNICPYSRREFAGKNCWLILLQNNSQ